MNGKVTAVELYVNFCEEYKLVSEVRIVCATSYVTHSRMCPADDVNL